MNLLRLATSGWGRGTKLRADRDFREVPFEDLCLRVRAQDLAGNVGPVYDVCGPCNARVDAPESGGTHPSSEPEWSPDERVPGGYCEGGPTPQDEESARSEGCSATPGAGEVPWSLLLLLLCARRRRRAPRSAFPARGDS